MRTTSTQKVRPDKRTVPIKWRDNSWYPRIVIRSLNSRGAGFSYWEADARPPGAESWSQSVRVLRIRRLSRAGGRSPSSGRCEISDTKASLLYGRSRLSAGSRSVNPL